MEVPKLFLELIAATNKFYEKNKGVEPADNVVQIQKTVELLMLSHCQRMGNRADALFVVDAMHKHATQMINTWFDEEGDKSISGKLMRSQ